MVQVIAKHGGRYILSASLAPHPVVRQAEGRRLRGCLPLISAYYLGAIEHEDVQLQQANTYGQAIVVDQRRRCPESSFTSAIG